MNRFVIFYLSAFFCISFAPAQAETEKCCDLKEGGVYSETSSGFYNYKNQALYRTVDEEGGTPNYWFGVGKNARKLTDDFQIFQSTTIVTKESIIIAWKEDRKIVLTLDEVTTFTVYKILFPHAFENFGHSLPVVKASQGNEELRSLSALKTKLGEDGKWVFIVLARSTPRLIFPASAVLKSSLVKNVAQVSFTVKAILNMQISITFEAYNHADLFSDLLKQ